MPSSLSADALQPYDILKLEEGGMAPPYKVDTQYHLLKLVKRENEKAQTLRNLFYRDEKHNDLCFQESRQPAPDQQHYFEQLEIHPDGRVTGKRYCFALNDTRPQYTEYGSITVRSQSLNGIDACHYSGIWHCEHSATGVTGHGSFDDQNRRDGWWLREDPRGTKTVFLYAHDRVEGFIEYSTPCPIPTQEDRGDIRILRSLSYDNAIIEENRYSHRIIQDGVQKNHRGKSCYLAGEKVSELLYRWHEATQALRRGRLAEFTRNMLGTLKNDSLFSPEELSQAYALAYGSSPQPKQKKKLLP